MAECSWDMEAAGELLYLQPFEEGLSYAIRNDVRLSAGGVDGTPGGAILHVEPRWQPGLRVMIGYVPSVTLRLTWMLFLADTVNHARTGLSPTGVGLQSTWIPPVDESVAMLYSSARFHWKLDFNAIDFDLGKRYDVSPFLSFHPACSVRFLQADQSFHAIYGELDHAKALNDFRGIGPRFFLSSFWGFAHGWEIVSSLSFAALYGRMLTQYGFQAALPSQELLMGNLEQLHVQVANADFSLGVGWGRSLFKERWHLGARLSYEVHFFWDQKQFWQPLGIDAPALLFQEIGNLSIQGFALRGEVDF
jgi:hypothetical protein